mmetsp:Transcript_15204/g.20110  ORF Transcript_15204/g.20110 Transcript_15204/m.20110 type:complete len:367 (+) Transcript_15204:101-1201(+)
MSTFQRPVKVAVSSTLPTDASQSKEMYHAIAPSFALKATVLLLLLGQNTSYTLLRRYSMASLKEKYDPQEVLLMGELFKLIFSVAMTWSDPSPSDAGPGGHLFERLSYLTIHSGKMMALAGIYGTMNVLSFVAIRRIDAAVFTVCAQLKILTTAAFSVLILKRRLTPTKWRALVQLVLGCILVTVPQISHKHTTSEEEEEEEEPNSEYTSSTQFLFGVLAVLLEVSMSGFASIYFEKVIKTADEKLTVWDRNYQLALHSILLYSIYSFVERNYFTLDPPPYRPLHDFSHVAWTLAFLGGGGGLLVAMTVKVADSIVKTLAVSIAIVTSTLASHFLLGGPLDLPMTIGALIVALAVLNYTLDATYSS